MDETEEEEDNAGVDVEQELLAQLEGQQAALDELLQQQRACLDGSAGDEDVEVNGVIEQLQQVAIMVPMRA